MSGPRQNRKKWIAVKIESQKGVAESVDGDDAKILAFDLNIDQENEFEDRAPFGLTMGKIDAVPSEYAGRCRFRVELRGSGTAATRPVWANALLGCGFKETADGYLTWAQTSDIDTQSTVTIVVWEDGVRKSIIGAMGNVIFDMPRFGRRAFAEFDFRGVWVTPTDESAPSITHESTAPLRFASANWLLGGSAGPSVSKMRIDMRNEVNLRPDITAESAIAHAFISDQMPRLEFDPEARLVADDDVFGDWLAGTTMAFSLQLGTADANTLTIAGNKLQYIDPKNGSRDGLQVLEVAADFNVTSGDDAISITHGNYVS